MEAFPRGISASGAFLTELSFLDKYEDDTQEDSRWNSFDTVHYTGFSEDGCTPFPKGNADCSPATILAKTLDNLCLPPNAGKRRLRRILRSPETEPLMLDIFWWTFLQNFDHKPRFTTPVREQHQSKLFSRMAVNYCKLFRRVRADNPQSESDEALRFYPDALCQAVYRAFYTCFPDARTRFGDAFKSALLQIVTYWFTGVPIGAHNNSVTWSINAPNRPPRRKRSREQENRSQPTRTPRPPAQTGKASTAPRPAPPPAVPTSVINPLQPKSSLKKPPLPEIRAIITGQVLPSPSASGGTSSVTEPFPSPTTSLVRSPKGAPRVFFPSAIRSLDSDRRPLSSDSNATVPSSSTKEQPTEAKYQNQETAAIARKLVAMQAEGPLPVSTGIHRLKKIVAVTRLAAEALTRKPNNEDIAAIRELREEFRRIEVASRAREAVLQREAKAFQEKREQTRRKEVATIWAGVNVNANVMAPRLKSAQVHWYENGFTVHRQVFDDVPEKMNLSARSPLISRFLLDRGAFNPREMRPDSHQLCPSAATVDWSMADEQFPVYSLLAREAVTDPRQHQEEHRLALEAFRKQCDELHSVFRSNSDVKDKDKSNPGDAIKPVQRAQLVQFHQFGKLLLDRVHRLSREPLPVVKAQLPAYREAFAYLEEKVSQITCPTAVEELKSFTTRYRKLLHSTEKETRRADVVQSTEDDPNTERQQDFMSARRLQHENAVRAQRAISHKNLTEARLKAERLIRAQLFVPRPPEDSDSDSSVELLEFSKKSR
eukprot:TRINITY_DN5476_c0_g1_i1.p1 TRINITY_DN5476_c0_g1~~TRINITY_DN5476_c0_g1_i1.p1  ORF type:complete len:771 (-),score=94.31 TRINITY_DN5476_c0_g1_i1:17-2329(-)